MLWVTKYITIDREAFLVILLVAMILTWFADSYPATRETCRPPLV